MAIYTIANTKASRKLKIGPAATTEIRAQTDLELNAFSLLSSKSSPTIIHEPPNGISFQEYLVSPFTKLAILGPIPSENSVTPIPFFFARRKCPNS